jgi:hypothetical protein
MSSLICRRRAIQLTLSSGAERTPSLGGDVLQDAVVSREAPALARGFLRLGRLAEPRALAEARPDAACARFAGQIPYSDIGLPINSCRSSAQIAEREFMMSCVSANPNDAKPRTPSTAHPAEQII